MEVQQTASLNQTFANSKHEIGNTVLNNKDWTQSRVQHTFPLNQSFDNNKIKISNTMFNNKDWTQTYIPVLPRTLIQFTDTGLDGTRKKQASG